MTTKLSEQQIAAVNEAAEQSLMVAERVAVFKVGDRRQVKNTADAQAVTECTTRVNETCTTHSGQLALSHPSNYITMNVGREAQAKAQNAQPANSLHMKTSPSAS